MWLRLAGSLLTVGLLAWLLIQQGWEKIVAAFLLIPPGVLVVVLILTLVSRLAVALRWYVLLRAAGEQVPPGQALRITFAGLFASNFLPTTVGGDVVRLAGAVQLRFDGAVSVATLIADRLVGMAGMAAVLPWGLVRLFASDLVLTRQSEVLLSAVALPMWMNRLRDRLVQLSRRFWDTLILWRHRPRALAASFGFTLLYMVMKFTTIWMMLNAMGQEMPWMTIAGVWGLVYFVTLLPVSINGYGLQEVSVTLLYSNLGGITPEAAVTVALLIRTMEMAASLPGALFVPGILAARK
jgi:uncharacterized membrane protein YbhN (UPF0104 family)